MARPERIQRVLLDASCLIGVIAGDEHYSALRSLLAAIDRGEVILVESTAILAEVLPAHPRGDPDKRHAVLELLLESPEVQLVDVSTPVARKAAALRVQHGLRRGTRSIWRQRSSPVSTS